MDLKTIINKCLGRDERAFDKLYNRYAPAFRGICLRYANSEQEADDILQEACIKIFRNLKQLKDVKAFEGWAKRIVINTALKYIKERKNYSQYLNIDNVEDTVLEEAEDDYSLEAMANLNMEELVVLMDYLPEGYRTILNLYAIEGFSHKDIAEMIGIKEASSRSQYFKAKKAFQTIILEQITEQKYEKVAV